jgi:hypothetical protein
MNNDRITKILDYSLESELINQNGDSKSIAYIVTELAPYSQLFDFLQQTGAFKENLTRFYAA